MKRDALQKVLKSCYTPFKTWLFWKHVYLAVKRAGIWFELENGLAGKVYRLDSKQMDAYFSRLTATVLNPIPYQSYRKEHYVVQIDWGAGTVSVLFEGGTALGEIAWALEHFPAQPLKYARYVSDGDNVFPHDETTAKILAQAAESRSTLQIGALLA
jgi:hypothetical protein